MIETIIMEEPTHSNFKFFLVQTPQTEQKIEITKLIKKIVHFNITF